MTRQFLSRLSAAAATAALAVTTLATVGAAPANADNSTCATTTTLTVGATTVEYGDYESLRGETAVASCSGGEATTYIGTGAGTIYLERSFDGRTWTPVKQGEYEDYVSWYDKGIVPATAFYRARYTGGKESTTYDPDTFTGSVSAPVRINVIRAVSLKDKSKGGHIVGRFKITPPTGLVGKKLTFQVKKGKKWKKYKKVKVRAGGVMKSNFRGSRKGVKYRLIVPAAGGLSGYVYGPYTAHVY